MKEKEKKSIRSDWKAFFKLIPQIKLPWILIIFAFLVNLAHSEIMALVPVSTSELFSGNFTNKALTDAVIYNFLNLGLVTVGTIISSIVILIAVRRARTILWSKMLSTTTATYDQNAPNSLLSTISEDSEVAVSAIINQLTSLIPSLYAVYKIVKNVGKYDFRLLLSVLILIPVNVVIVIIVGKLRFKANVKIYDKIGSMTGYLTERVANIPLIKNYTNEKKETEQGLRVSKELHDAKIDSAKVTVLADGVSSLTEVAQKLLSIVFGSILLAQGAITVKEWIAFFLYLNLLIPQINSLISIWNSIKAAQGNAARMIEILNFESETSNAGESIVASGDIVFENVNFYYGDKKALDNVNFCIPANKSTAIVGVCGSGKSTILSLIERLYQTESGVIRIAGMDISLFDLESYRSLFAYVQQDAGVFSGSLRESLTYGLHREVRDEEILEAARKTGAIKLIEELEDGLDGQIAISGRSVSGGQRQRIVLTRELLKSKEILILDEPTSALDSKTALEVQKNIFELFSDKTLIFVTHDLRMLKSVDQIIVVEQGKIAATGTHEELLMHCDGYNRLIHAREIKEVED